MPTDSSTIIVTIELSEMGQILSVRRQGVYGDTGAEDISSVNGLFFSPGHITDGDLSIEVFWTR